jgi:8-oxo-(d)GTP phosphatase
MLKNKHFDIVLENNIELTSKLLQGNVLIKNASTYQIYVICRLTEVKKLKALKSITLSVEDKKAAQHFLRDQFKIIKAAGGVIYKDDELLMILRFGKWDLPKGKLEKAENPLLCAVREVEEECGLKVKVEEKLPSTWHSYNMKGKRIMKKTHWYLMKCTDDTEMKPQIEEDIEDLKWMDKGEVKLALKNSYSSINYLLKKIKAI